MLIQNHVSFGGALGFISEPGAMRVISKEYWLVPRPSEPVDFREQQGVYCLYDDNFRLVYLGQAGGKNDQRHFIRLRQHREDFVSERWTRFSWFGVRQVLNTGNLKAEKTSAHPDVGEVFESHRGYSNCRGGASSQ
jgi:hypothetical protein